MTLSGRLIVQATESLGRDEGGPAVVVAQLADAAAEFGGRAEVVEADRCTGPRLTVDASVSVVQDRRLADDSALLHVHGLWRTTYARLAAAARRRHIPVLVSVHGMLEPWALAQRPVAKRLARIAYQDVVLRSSSCLHVTSRDEAKHVRALGFDVPVAVVPLGIDVDGGQADAQPAAQPDTRVALFMSRIHPKKALDRLLVAWQRLDSARPGWQLVIAGYDDDGHQEQLRTLSGHLGVNDSVQFAGPLEGHAKASMLARAELFVLPSHSENFGLVVVEALASGVPVIASTGTPWAELAAEPCGWWVDNDVDSLARALCEAMTMPPGDLRDMGRRGRALVMRRYTSRVFREAFGELYAWLLGTGPRPEFVT